MEAVDQVEIRPRVSGYIKRVVFAEGKEVRKGDLLFQIDPPPLSDRSGAGGGRACPRALRRRSWPREMWSGPSAW